MSVDVSADNGRVLQGTVVSDKMQKTVVVKVDRRVKHALYSKIITRCTKYHVHDEDGICKMGDKVRIRETRPISKRKSWTLLNVVGDET